MYLIIFDEYEFLTSEQSIEVQERFESSHDSQEHELRVMEHCKVGQIKRCEVPLPLLGSAMLDFEK